MKTLYIIPARGGSKSIPLKNVKLLAERPLIWYTLDVATKMADKADICVSTDSKMVEDCVKEYGINIPFLRPSELSEDSTGQFEVIKHALEFYKQRGVHYDSIVLLQVTSPFRRVEQVKKVVSQFHKDIDMVASVCKASANPYYLLFEEDIQGFLVKSKEGHFKTRQDCPEVWQLNGSVYVINPKSLEKYDSFSHFKKVEKSVMPALMSVDIDNDLDWEFSEYLSTKIKIVD